MDTFIVIRSLLPCIVQVGEVVIYDAQPPSPAAALSLVGIALGAVGFMLVEAELIQVRSYSWGIFYLVVMSAECLVTKKIVSSIKLHPWGLVLYNNVVGAPNIYY